MDRAVQGCDGGCGRGAWRVRQGCGVGCGMALVPRCAADAVAADLGIFASRLKIFDYFNIS